MAQWLRVQQAEAATKLMVYAVANAVGGSGFLQVGYAVLTGLAMHVSVLAEEDAVSVSRFSVDMLLLHRPSLLGCSSILRQIQVMSKAEVVLRRSLPRGDT